MGLHLEAMLIQMNDRGPDSAGVAFYRNPAPAGSCKLTLHHPDEAYDWAGLTAAAAREFGGDAHFEQRANHAVVYVGRRPVRPSCGWLWPIPRCG